LLNVAGVCVKPPLPPPPLSLAAVRCMAAEVIRSVLRIINTDRNSVFCVVNFRRLFILQVGGLSSRYNECFSLRDYRWAIFSSFDISNYDIPSEATYQLLRVEVSTPGHRRVWGCVPEQRRIEARTGSRPAV